MNFTYKFLYVTISLFLFIGCASAPVTTVTPPILVKQGVYRSSRPADICEYKAFIKYALDLEADKQTVEKERLRALFCGIEFKNIPMSGLFRPSVSDLKEAVSTIENKKTQGILVHCLHGHDRTGITIAADRILVDGWTVEQAYAEAERMGHTNPLYKNWFINWKRSLNELKEKKK